MMNCVTPARRSARLPLVGEPLRRRKRRFELVVRRLVRGRGLAAVGPIVIGQYRE
jgi:hypothetical protein